jgi:hypothetical protein
MAEAAVGRFKCNIDTTFSFLWNSTGVEVCFPDEDDTYVLAKTISFLT